MQLPEPFDGTLPLEATPADTTLSVGDSFEPTVRVERCPDPRKVSADLTSEDESVVKISDGKIHAVAVGSTNVMAAEAEMTATISVKVVE